MIFKKKFTKKRTKIIATIGPAITNEFYLTKNNKILLAKIENNFKLLFANGVNVCRLNFSHGNQKNHLAVINLIKDVANKNKKNIGIMLDTKGPEIRVGDILDKNQKQVKLMVNTNDILTIKTKDFKKPLSKNEFYVCDSTQTYNMAKDVKANDVILIDDGKLQLTVLDSNATKGIIKAKACNNHFIIANKRINLPGCHYSLPFLSNKDKNDIIFAIENELDYIALSFVNKVEDILAVKKIIASLKPKKIPLLIAKIESFLAINNFDQILANVDGIMVARGDLALDVPFYKIPIYQNMMVEKCRLTNKIVIIATQMLDSLERNLLPTRAEVSDVYYATINGVDCTMLSGESANGIDPVNAVKVMSTINSQTELDFDYKKAFNLFLKNKNISSSNKNKIKKLIKNKHFNTVNVICNDLELVNDLSNARLPFDINVYTSNQQIASQQHLRYGINAIFCSSFLLKSKDFNRGKIVL